MPTLELFHTFLAMKAVADMLINRLHIAELEKSTSILFKL